ncbi:Protein NRT1/ PTR FAMILY 2.9 [Linum grandiflorum]
MVSVTGIVYVQSDVSWAIGLGIPAFLMFLSCAVFFWGTSIYVLVKPQGSPLTSVVQVLVAASRKKRLQLPLNPHNSLFNYLPPKSLNSHLSHTAQFRCLDKAAISTEQDEYKPDGSPKQPWRLCSVQQVEEVKCIARILPIWSTSILFHIAIMQQQTYGIFQALQSDRRLGNGGFRVPAATYIIFTMLALTFWIPIYDRIIVPYLEKITGKEGGITLLQRMGVGLVLGILCMVTSGLVEEYRKHIAETKPGIGIAPKGGDISVMSSMWLVPQLVLTGLAEAFNYIAQVEFYYKQFPESMRSIAQAFFFAGNALSSYLSGFLVSVVHQMTSGGDHSGDWLPDDLNKGKLDYFYFMLAGLGILNLGYFFMCARWYVYKGDLKSTGDDAQTDKNMHIAV